jgi:hypothetical protein
MRGRRGASRTAVVTCPATVGQPAPRQTRDGNAQLAWQLSKQRLRHIGERNTSLISKSIVQEAAAGPGVVFINTPPQASDAPRGHRHSRMVAALPIQHRPPLSNIVRLTYCGKSTGERGAGMGQVI